MTLRARAVVAVLAVALGAVGCGGSSKSAPAPKGALIASNTTDLAAIPAAGGKPRAIAAGHSLVQISRPRVSPDGRSIVFGGQRCGSCTPTLDVVPIAGGPSRQLATSASEPDWSSDGREIAYVYQTPNGASKGLLLYVVPRDGGTRRKLRVEEPGEEAEPVPVFHNPTYAPQGRMLAYDKETEPNEVEQLLLLDLATGEAHDVTRGKRAAARPAFSPDGRELVYVCENAAGLHDICLISAGGGRPRVLAATSGDDKNPVFSPDGKTIVFDSDVADRKLALPSLYAVALDGTGLHRLTSGFAATQPAFTPDGRTIVFSRRAIVRQRAAK